jgi:uncharacterized protein (TIGR02391 family)
MDREWAVKQLGEFRHLIDELKFFDSECHYVGDDDDIQISEASYQDVIDRLVLLEPTMRDLIEAARPGLSDYEEPAAAGYSGYSNIHYWLDIVRDRVLKATGIHLLAAEAREKMRPDSPDLVADQLHPWVWKAAAPLWEAGSRQEAVHAAARSVNARLQQKLGRHDKADAKLCREAFSLNDPTADQPRLRFAGNRSSETWRSRQQGALDFSAGCFEAIRNPAAHVYELDIPEQVAMEQLGALSLLARWIDACKVSRSRTARAGRRGRLVGMSAK